MPSSDTCVPSVPASMPPRRSIRRGSTTSHVLHSRFRASLVTQRDRMLEVAGRRRTWSVVRGNGVSARVEVRVAPTKVVHAVKGVLADTGRATVLIGFGDQVEDADFVALTVPDAHELVRTVQLALDASLPNLGG